ncbi:TolB-like 6-bladed beta-propeller domain-containing protein [Bacteroidales bacterium OttesenSCG-928-L03]|nr:TolB-like 6-bladed beta-propeller domain-containing protein [Bacteroidales bacterium OttesenSCG-928-L03]
MVRRIFFFLLISLLFLSCSVDVKYEKFKEHKELVPIRQQIEVDDSSCYMRYPIRVRLADSLLFVMDLHAPIAYCHQFTYPGLEYMKSLAYRGEALGQFINADNIRINPNGSLLLLSANQNCIVRINPDTGETESKLNLPKNLLRTLDFIQLPDSSFIVPDYTGTHRLTMISPTGEILDRLHTIPRSKEQESEGVVLAQAWRSFIDYNPENGILAMVTQLGEVLEAYDMKNDSLIKVTVGRAGVPEFIDKGSYAVPNGIMGYGDVQVTKDRIYALFWNTSLKDIRQEKENIDGGRFIHEFDLNGNPICQYELDRYITGFCIDEEKEQIIALDINSNAPIVVYDLK